MPCIVESPVASTIGGGFALRAALAADGERRADALARGRAARRASARARSPGSGGWRA